ncbi:hypothetical protein K2W90_01935 [Candidatus Babeliales bacterium]|nr:hypothetical protein [Candidatus Babeliales bacterium]
MFKSLATKKLVLFSIFATTTFFCTASKPSLILNNHYPYIAALNKWLTNNTFALTPPSIITKTKKTNDQIRQEAKQTKEWNIIVYMAANNNLHAFSIKNLQQMIHIGSNERINIVVQLDGYRMEDVSRFYIEKDNPVLISSFNHTAATISGTTQSLLEFVTWALETYPAKQQALVLWNHGSGIKDPHIWGKKIISHRDEFFFFNHQTCLLELNRHLLDHDFEELEERGIAFNDTFETYITNQELKDTLDTICTNALNNKKIDLLFFDACHMAMVEIGSQIKSAVHYMVGSEEIEPGGGHNYIYALEPFLHRSFSPAEFACHLVNAYEQEYINFNADYTQSAINLTAYESLEKLIKQITANLRNLLQQEPETLTQVLQSIRYSRRFTTEFGDPDYIDFCLFFQTLEKKLSALLTDQPFTQASTIKISETVRLLQQSLTLMLEGIIIKNIAGLNLPYAQGLAIYFPRRSIDPYYRTTIFDQTTQWSEFLHTFGLNLRNLGNS